MRRHIFVFFLNLFVAFNLSCTQELPTNASQGEMVIDDAANLEIACHSDFIEVTVESKNYPGLDTNVTHLEDEACVPVYKDDSKAVFRFGLEECKTKHEDDGKMVSYSNRIVAVVRDVVDEADITRKSTRILPFKCSYQKKTLLSKVSYSPRYVQVVTDAENYGNFTYLMNMYTDKENSKKVEKFPLLVGISQRLYISLKVQSGDSDLSLFPDECKATPSTEYNAKPDHKMIEQGCPRDRYLEYEYEKSAYQNFSFVAFRFKKGYDDVYIHCKLTVCRSDDEKSKCDSGCQEEGNQSRRKRNIHDEYRTELYVGPIKMTNEQDKAMKSGETPTIIKEKSKTVLLVGVLAGVLGAISLGLVGALIILTRRGRHSETGATLLVQDD